jgi:hypothetical protein
MSLIMRLYAGPGAVTNRNLDGKESKAISQMRSSGNTSHDLHASETAGLEKEQDQIVPVIRSGDRFDADVLGACARDV